jgi:hypothetical protein
MTPRALIVHGIAKKTPAVITPSLRQVRLRIPSPTGQHTVFSTPHHQMALQMPVALTLLRISHPDQGINLHTAGSTPARIHRQRHRMRMATRPPTRSRIAKMLVTVATVVMRAGNGIKLIVLRRGLLVVLDQSATARASTRPATGMRRR